MALTKGELVQVGGRLLVRIGEKLDEPATPNTISRAEAVQLFQDTIQDLLKEYAD